MSSTATELSVTVPPDPSTTVSVILRQEMFLRSGPCSMVIKPGSWPIGSWAGGAGICTPLRRASLAARLRAARFMLPGSVITMSV